MTAESFDTVLVVDFGAQYAQLIARRVREAQRLQRDRAAHDAGGGDAGARTRRRSSCPAARPQRLRRGRAAGRPGPLRSRRARVRHLLRLPGDGAGARRHGRPHRACASSAAPPLNVADRDSALFAGLPREQSVWMSHGDSVTRRPAGFAVSAPCARAPRSPPSRTSTGACAGVQFHPEVLHTAARPGVLEHFLYEIAGCRPDVDA